MGNYSRPMGPSLVELWGLGSMVGLGLRGFGVQGFLGFKAPTRAATFEPAPASGHHLLEGAGIGLQCSGGLSLKD